jgi:Protein of unknown function (DUF2281)
MGTIELVEIIDKLPPDKKRVVEDLVFVLNEDTKIENHQDDINKKPKLKREFGGLKGFVAYMADDFDEPLKTEPLEKPVFDRGYGSLKGKIWMSDDFDEPLEEFKDYM